VVTEVAPLRRFLRRTDGHADGDRQSRILQAEGQAKAIRTAFDAIHTANPPERAFAYQYLQALPQIAEGSANKVWIIPTELTKALEGLGRALGGLAGMAHDVPAVDSPAVEREAEAAQAAAAEAGRSRRRYALPRMRCPGRSVSSRSADASVHCRSTAPADDRVTGRRPPATP
jgi:hypothetical protein